MPELLIAQTRSLVPENCLAVRTLDTESDDFHLALARVEEDEAQEEFRRVKDLDSQEWLRADSRLILATRERCRIERDAFGLLHATFEDIQE